MLIESHLDVQDSLRCGINILFLLDFESDTKVGSGEVDAGYAEKNQ